MAVIFSWAGSGIRAVLYRLAIVILTLGAQGTPAYGQSQTPPEYQLKAVFLFNFAQFVEWPPSAFPSPDAPLVIGVLGDDPFGQFLDQTVAGEKVDNRVLIVRRFRQVDEITNCHILFISRSELGRLSQILGQLNGRSILTVGDFETFARTGGMVRFVTESNRIRLRINLEAAEAANLKLSSKLLRPAVIVSPGRD